MPSLKDEVVLPCGLKLPNRLVKAALAEGISSKNNSPDEQFQKLYGSWAEGGWGMILTGNVQVDPKYLGAPADLCVDSALVSDPVYRKAWKDYAFSCSPSPVVMQINHPGRQTPLGAGTKGFFEKGLAPSAVGLQMGPGILDKGLSALLFGTPKAMSIEEVNLVIKQFADAAKFAYESGFSGVELHAAHGYLLAQFMSKKTNLRDDKFGGSASARVEIVVRIINAVRAATSPKFAVGIKLNSVDVDYSGDTNEEFLEQVRRIVDAGIDFLEVSGGTYEKPSMFEGNVTDRTKNREAFFLTFASLIRDNFPSVLLMVTGGFRSLAFMEEAVSTKQVDLIGMGRPAILNPLLPREVMKGGADPSKKFDAPRKFAPFPLSWIPIKFVGVGFENGWYQGKLKELAL